MTKNELTKQKGSFERFLDWVERVGNKLPHPFFLFVYLTIGIMILSAVLSTLQVSAINPGSGEEVVVKSLLTREGVEWMLVNALKNFTGFAPLGLVLSMQMGIGLA